MNTQSATAVPSGRALAKATIVAMLLGGAVLVTTVLPAEFGLDPVGTGRVLGLLDLYASESAAAAPALLPPGLPGAPAVTAGGTPMKISAGVIRKPPPTPNNPLRNPAVKPSATRAMALTEISAMGRYNSTT